MGSLKVKEDEIQSAPSKVQGASLAKKVKILKDIKSVTKSIESRGIQVKDLIGTIDTKFEYENDFANNSGQMLSVKALETLRQQRHDGEMITGLSFGSPRESSMLRKQWINILEETPRTNLGAKHECIKDKKKSK